MTNEIEVDRPPAGTACESCKAKGHFCPARAYGEAGEPRCLFCASDVKCPTAIAAEPKAPTFHVEELEESQLGEVRHIDPATVEIKPLPDSEPKRTEAGYRVARNEAAKLIRDVEARQAGRKSGHKPRRAARVIMPAHAVMGAEMIDPHLRNRVQETKEETTMNEKKKCAKEGCTNNAAANGSYCTAKHYYDLQKDLGLLGVPRPKKQAKAKPAPASRYERELVIAKERQKPTLKDGTPNRQARPAQAAEEITPVAVGLSFTEAQCDAIYLGFTPQQKAIALAAALQAALQSVAI